MGNNSKIVKRKDVAKRANVSETLVSYVINGNRYVEAEKKKRIIEAIKELNYKPNAIARSLKTKKTNHIAFITSEIDNEYFGSIVNEMENLAYNKGYLISLCSFRDNNNFIMDIISRQFDGIVISGDIPVKYVKKLADSKIPLVFLSNRICGFKQSNFSTVKIDIYTGARQAMQSLIKVGRKKIVFIDSNNNSNPDSILNVSEIYEPRLKAYVNILMENGIEVNSKNIINNYGSIDSLVTIVKEYIKKDKGIDAFFCHDDRHAFAVMGAIQKMGLVVSKDIDVIGFDNSSISRYSSPAMSSVDIPRKEIGRIIIELLYRAINEGVYETINLETKFIKRESSS